MRGVLEELCGMLEELELRAGMVCRELVARGRGEGNGEGIAAKERTQSQREGRGRNLVRGDPGRV